MIFERLVDQVNLPCTMGKTLVNNSAGRLLPDTANAKNKSLFTIKTHRKNISGNNVHRDRPTLGWCDLYFFCQNNIEPSLDRVLLNQFVILPIDWDFFNKYLTLRGSVLQSYFFFFYIKYCTEIEVLLNFEIARRVGEFSLFLFLKLDSLQFPCF